ncbi:MAG TPA: hypothetical protein VKK31_10005 [Thermoanaerobaculia bacterium]|nr:hypothetical protein [Thermoanaerobaculia bacterium]
MADEKKEPMIGQDQRPGQIDLDRPLADMKLRDLITILGGAQALPEWLKPERIKPEQLKPETFKPEQLKPELIKPEWWKPEWIKPEAFKPESFKELSKPELSKPFDIDQIFDPVLDALSKDQLKQLSEKVQRKLG